MLAYSRYKDFNKYKNPKRYLVNIVDSPTHFKLFIAIAQGNITLTDLRKKLKKSDSTLQEQLGVLERNGAITRALIQPDKPRSKTKYKYEINYKYFLNTLEERLGEDATKTTKGIIQNYFNDYYPNNKSIKKKSQRINLFPAQTFLDLTQKLPYYVLTNRPKNISEKEFAIQGWYLLFILEEIMKKASKKNQTIDLSFFKKFGGKKREKLRNLKDNFWLKPEIQAGMKKLIKFNLDNMEDDKNGKN